MQTVLLLAALACSICVERRDIRRHGVRTARGRARRGVALLGWMLASGALEFSPTQLFIPVLLGLVGTPPIWRRAQEHIDRSVTRATRTYAVKRARTLVTIAVLALIISVFLGVAFAASRGFLTWATPARPFVVTGTLWWFAFELSKARELGRLEVELGGPILEAHQVEERRMT